MSDALIFAEIGQQHVELLPERTVMSLTSMAVGNTGGSATGGAGADVLGTMGYVNPATSVTASCFGGTVTPPSS